MVAIRKLAIVLTALVLLIFVLVQGKFLFAPLVLAIFLGILLSPPVRYLESKGFHPILSNLVVVGLSFIAAIGILFMIGTQYFQMIEDLPSLSKSLGEYADNASEYAIERFGLSEAFINNSIAELFQQAKSQIGSAVSTFWTSLSNFISFVFLLPIFTFLILFYRDNLKEFIHELSKSNDNVTFDEWIGAISDIQNVVRKYLYGILFVTSILAILNTVGLLILDIPYALVLGCSSALLAIIPYIGNLIGGGFAVFMALASSENIWVGVAVIVLYTIVQVLEGNFITPKIMGDQIGVNPLVIIIGLLVGGFIWGIVGMVLAVPVIAILKTVMERKSELKALTELMEGH
jgi:predicted PurR-regulated permease PerM